MSYQIFSNTAQFLSLYCVCKFRIAMLLLYCLLYLRKSYSPTEMDYAEMYDYYLFKLIIAAQLHCTYVEFYKNIT